MKRRNKKQAMLTVKLKKQKQSVKLKKCGKSKYKRWKYKCEIEMRSLRNLMLNGSSYRCRKSSWSLRMRSSYKRFLGFKKSLRSHKMSLNPFDVNLEQYSMKIQSWSFWYKSFGMKIMMWWRTTCDLNEISFHSRCSILKPISQLYLLLLPASIWLNLSFQK